MNALYQRNNNSTHFKHLCFLRPYLILVENPFTFLHLLVKIFFTSHSYNIRLPS